MFNPISTYRVQFNKDFKFADLENILPYLRKLGVRTIYASPIFQATKGSTHGYDATDPNTINPEIGTDEELRRLSRQLKEYGMGWIQDIVPNHMAFSTDNKLIKDLLENGWTSSYKDFFDCSFSNEFYSGKILLPFLGCSLDQALNNGELKIHWLNDGLYLKYYENYFPLSPGSYKTIFEKASSQLGATTSDAATNDGRQLVQGKEQLVAIYNTPDGKQYIDRSLDVVNNATELLMEIVHQQHYELCDWRTTDHKINYRRFFLINGLICVNIQHPDVFNFYHRKIFELLREGVFDGLRVDHVDGLFDPTSYLVQLRDAVPEGTYIVVEKILQFDEPLPEAWPIQGTTGYDFLAVVNNVLSDPKSEKTFSKIYDKLLDKEIDCNKEGLGKKAYILDHHMQGELDNLTNLFIKINPEAANIGEQVRNTIRLFLVHCPVYRYYGNSLPLGSEEHAAISSLIDKLSKHHPELDKAIGLLRNTLLSSPDEQALSFYKRCMQITGPLTAKGIEDTLMYTYSRFIAHNEVGDNPALHGITLDDFHERMVDRAEKWPHALNATATHDTKRGEDARARLNVLTNLKKDWADIVEHWRKSNKELTQKLAIDVNDEYFIYQSVLACCPVVIEDFEHFKTRLKEYLIKAFREAKTHTNWSDPNTEYENKIAGFADAILDANSKFRKSFNDFFGKVVDYGILNSLTQLLLKFTCPGIPDTYQGTELWDLSFVDPDNRLAVNYERRSQLLDEIAGQPGEGLLASLWSERFSGKIKLALTHKLLGIRAKYPELYSQGAYIPLEVKGKHKQNVLAFARRLGDSWHIIATAVHLAEICPGTELLPQAIDWGNTHIVLPGQATGKPVDLLYGSELKNDEQMLIQELFKFLPMAVIGIKSATNERGAGILMHISSLPSEYGIGDFGAEANKFLQFLSRNNQRFWQLLPLTQTTEGSCNSPYSSPSSMAGNILFISLENLAKMGLLELETLKKAETDKTDYKFAREIKEPLLEKAYERYVSGNFSKNEFKSFCEQQAYWLDDYALFEALTASQQGKPWIEWDDQYRDRDAKALHEFAQAHSRELDKIKWLQYIFNNQWSDLKKECSIYGVKLIGDIPFYVSYNSVDVWANRQFFCLNHDGSMNGVAGVPPDYFSETGQLWGMPTYNWNALKKDNYKWWMQRLRRNFSLFDLLRIDHFRAFAEYWQVPASETNAIHGDWLLGPGRGFFDTVRQELGNVSLIAEDLGDNMDPVYKLRDEINLPGMKVLQFAFDGYSPASVDVPHNYQENCIVYTGTHDNDTIQGWFSRLKQKDKKRLEQYTGRKVTAKNINEVLISMAYASVSKIAIIPMQDILGLPESSRMNLPGSAENNWEWRLNKKDSEASLSDLIADYTRLYNRV